jgi:[acyl-carrier-protein] S-malonyltransferase
VECNGLPLPPQRTGFVSSIAFVFPGQGSQYPGMGKELCEAHDVARRTFEQAAEATGREIARLCFDSSDDDLRRTDNAQIALLTVGVAAARLLENEGVRPSSAAGHSLGEYGALVCAGVVEFAGACRLVRVRGKAMARAKGGDAHAMAAVIGLDPEYIADLCNEVNGVVVVANYNSPTQTIISGEAAAVEVVGAACKGAGAKRVMPLNVGGAFHSPLMAGAADEMRRALADEEFRDPVIPVVANVTGRAIESGEEARRLLGDQITSSVRWVDSLRTLWKMGARVFVEVGPKKVLSGLVKQTLPDAVTLNVEDRETLRVAVDQLRTGLGSS